MLFLARILLVVTQVAYFPALPWCTAEGVVLVDLGDDQSSMG